MAKNKHRGSSFEDYTKELLKDPEISALMDDLQKQEECDKLGVVGVARVFCVSCDRRTDTGHKKCRKCRGKNAVQKSCTRCSTTGRYKAKGLCVKCYFRARRATAKAR